MKSFACSSRTFVDSSLIAVQISHFENVLLFESETILNVVFQRHEKVGCDKIAYPSEANVAFTSRRMSTCLYIDGRTS